MNCITKNSRSVTIRLLQPEDNNKLYAYLQDLSAESRSRFGPHTFDKDTIDTICSNLNDNILRYVAIDNLSNDIAAYMLIKQGMIEWDEKRYALRIQFYDYHSSVSFAPSVADAWQSTGLGTLMNTIIEEDLKKRAIKTIILWGGVQATNEKAVNFYKKLGYGYIATFWHDGKENYDMIKTL